MKKTAAISESGSHLTPALSPSGEGGAPGAREAKTLTALFEDAQNGMRRMVALGLYAHEIKSQLKHGQFGPWLAEHAPGLSREFEGRALASMTLTRYMQLASGVLECTGYKLAEYLEKTKITQCDLSHGGEILLLAEGEVPESSRPMREKICELIDGKTQRQLFAEFKTADEDEEGAVAKAGGAKVIKFHCPTCYVSLKGKLGTKIDCPACKTKVKVRPDPPTPEQELKARRALSEDLLECWRGPLRAFLDEQEEGGIELEAKDWQAALDDALSFTAIARKMLGRAKDAKGAKAAKKKGGGK